MATLFYECPVSFLQLGFNLCLCVPRIPCQAGHHHSCSQRLSLVKGPHCCIQLSASTSKEVEEGEMWKNTCTHFSGNARIGRRAVPQAGNTFPNLRPEEKHFVQEPKWVVVNKTVLLLLFELEPRRFWIVMEVSQQPPVSAFHTTGTECHNTSIFPQVSSFWITTQAGQPADVRFLLCLFFHQIYIWYQENLCGVVCLDWPHASCHCGDRVCASGWIPECVG